MCNTICIFNLAIYNIIDIYPPPKKNHMSLKFYSKGSFWKSASGSFFFSAFFKDSGSAWPSQSPPNDDLSKKFGKKSVFVTVVWHGEWFADLINLRGWTWEDFDCFVLNKIIWTCWSMILYFNWMMTLFLQTGRRYRQNGSGKVTYIYTLKPLTWSPLGFFPQNSLQHRSDRFKRSVLRWRCGGTWGVTAVFMRI